MSFSQFGLSAGILKAVADQGYTEPTPIQAQAIPVVLEGRDIMAGAQTGTGKTAGFTLPLLHRLSADNSANGIKGRRHPRALVLVPTRELAQQVFDSVQTYGRYLPLRSAVVFGGVSINAQIQALRKGIDILVATPGRLLDHVQQRTVDLSRIQILVLDEADRMLDMGFIHDIKRVMALLPPKRQNLLFSATFADEIKALADSLLHNPALVEVARRNTAAETVKQVVYPVGRERKRDLLAHLVTVHDMKQVLVFTRTKHGADRLSQQLDRAGIVSDSIHGNKSQPQRTRALKAFKDGRVRVLVATDVAARGIDIDLLPHVVNYDLPNVPEDYVHRIGRTGRAGNSGHAISLVSVDERIMLRNIERLLKRDIPKEVIAGFEPDPSEVPAPIATGRGRSGGDRAARAGRPEFNRRPGLGDDQSRSGRSGRPGYSSGGNGGSTASKPSGGRRASRYDWRSN
ncbi:MAG: DEAD/DEAH box helicase [Nitrospirota bacterium]|nr:DEAD/DEAH box helicase [Nitrospirota bacterium]